MGLIVTFAALFIFSACFQEGTTKAANALYELQSNDNLALSPVENFAAEAGLEKRELRKRSTEEETTEESTDASEDSSSFSLGSFILTLLINVLYVIYYLFFRSYVNSVATIAQWIIGLLGL